VLPEGLDIAAWKQRYLAMYDEQIDGLKPRGHQKEQRRAVIASTPDQLWLWITTAALSFIGAGIILHVGIGLRWPFAHKTMEENPASRRLPPDP
jgi:hypothetical protein